MPIEEKIRVMEDAENTKDAVNLEGEKLTILYLDQGKGM